MTHYETGDRWEKRTRELLETNGYITWQARQSRGVADIIAAKPTQTLLIQVKRINQRDPETSKIITHDEWNGIHQLATHLAWIPLLADWTGHTATLRLRRITGPHRTSSQIWPSEPFCLDEVTANAS